MNRSLLTRRRLLALVALSLGGGVAVAQSAGGSGSPAPAATATVPATATAASPPRRGVAQPVPRLAPPAALPPGVFRVGPCGERRRPTGGAPPSQALLDAFAILRRGRSAEDELPAAALKALRVRGLTPVSADAARVLRSAGDARAWVVPVPDVDRADPFVCKRAGVSPREGVAVVAIGAAPAGGGGALRDLVRGIAPVAVDPCAGEGHDMLGVSGIVPDGVPAVFLTAPDGTAVRADVKDNGFSFVVPRGRTPEPRYVVWTGADGTPHVQPVSAFVGGPRGACGRPIALPVVTPNGAYGCRPLPMIVPPIAAGRAMALVAPRALTRQRAAALQRQRIRRRHARILARRRSPIFLTAPCAIGMPARGPFSEQAIPPDVVLTAPAVPMPMPMPARPPRRRTP